VYAVCGNPHTADQVFGRPIEMRLSTVPTSAGEKLGDAGDRRPQPAADARSTGLGANDYIVKPFDPAVLLSRVQAVFRRLRVAAA
jgi:CheY-like chemotaxis protein